MLRTVARVRSAPRTAGISGQPTTTTRDEQRRSRVRAEVIRWVNRGFWAVMDQGLFALSNFAVNLLLARWLSPQEYGGFASAYAVFLLLGMAHTALLTEPMLVFGSGKYASRFSDYLALLLRAHWLLMGAGSLLLACAGLALWGAGVVLLGKAFLGLAAAAPFVLLTWLLRRACFVRLRPEWAATAGGLYFALLVSGTYLLYRRGDLSVITALAMLGLASLVASLWLSHRLRVSPVGRTRGAVPRDEVVADHWTYGRWALGSSGLSWVSEGVYYVVLPIWGGLAASGALKALTNLIMPVAQAQSALSILMVPGFVRARREGRMRHLVPVVMGLFAVGAASYWVCLGVWHREIVHWIYGGQYDGYSALLWVFGVLPLLGGMSDVLVAVLRALERPDLICRGYAGAAALAVSVGIALTAVWRVGGAALGYACSLALLGGILWLSFAKLSAAARAEPVQSVES